MPQNTHLQIIAAEAESLPRLEHEVTDFQLLHQQAEGLGRSLVWLPNTPSSTVFAARCQALQQNLKPLLRALTEVPPPHAPMVDDFRWLYDHLRLLYTDAQNVQEALRSLKVIPHVRTQAGNTQPRVLALAESFLQSVGYEFNEQEFSLFVEVFQTHMALQLSELWMLAPVLKLVLLEQIAHRGRSLLQSPQRQDLHVGVCVRSLRDLGQMSWKDVLEPLMVADAVLRQDPAGAYARMDFDSRDLCRKKLANIAAHSDCSEVEVASAALELAREARQNPSGDERRTQRESHVGYYLFDQGAPLLHHRVGFRAPWGQKVQAFLRKYPDDFYVPGIAFLTMITLAGVVLLLTGPLTPVSIIVLAMLTLLLPSSQSAVQVVNYLVTTILPPEILPKLDFSETVPVDCRTLVAVPCLLLNEKQVRGLVEDLEVRFLGNHDPNIHFALVSDLPDSREPAREDSPLVALCVRLIEELNQKYAGQAMGTFFLFHRHRAYNPREKAWMGWERKRGKLLDLNKLLRAESDNFPVKVGQLSLLSGVRFVITLDADTELPRGAARRMIGTLAHPLNQAIIDPEKNIVVAGYGILQPRVGVSVQSTAKSRLAALFAGETGFDIYTRAISDAYQDLYGEGSFTGKGIYEVATVHQVLNQRFPKNALLSHDLIEGAYARAGLASDIEVIEDYPSHYSAYNRRKHRWLRGDWQIAGWLFPEVEDESGARVPNPISLISWWKILDNLRRALVEPATFLLLAFAWLARNTAPGYWTLAVVCILFIPAWFQFAFNLVRALWTRSWPAFRDSFTALLTANLNVFFTLTFLAHQTILSLDAMFRALVRRFVTHYRLLEWETAQEAELGTRGRAPVDVYLNWIPLLSLGLGFLVWSTQRPAFTAALPILLLWALSKPIASWLNQPLATRGETASRKDTHFLRRAALHTWRYFAEFSTEEHHWLVPDNVQEEPAAVAARTSPTNLGLLLNARQVACEFGYLTVPEFAAQTLKTLDSVARLEKYRGHLLNWYDTRTLQPLAPLFVSSVDNGNWLASLWTLQQGCLDRLRQPALQPSLAEGLLDYLHVLASLRACPRKHIAACRRDAATGQWLSPLWALPETLFAEARQCVQKSHHADTMLWFVDQAEARLHAIRQAVYDLAPWQLPEFAALRRDPAVNLHVLDTVALEKLPTFLDRIGKQLCLAAYATPEKRELRNQLLAMIPQAQANARRLAHDLRSAARKAEKLANDTDFSFLLDAKRKLVAVGFDVETRQLFPACYDLLGTESRTAVFVAIAKEDIPQESWFLLGRAHTLDHGRPALLSWTGTAFEYLMPSLWMRSYTNTLLERARTAAVRAQQEYASARGVPWGISESAYYQLDEAGNYQYHAFGLPNLALREREIDSLVISPYSTFLALSVDPAASLRNLRRMEGMGWFGSHGFYEAADYSAGPRRFWQGTPKLVRCWMAHHQGMSLLALANFLRDNIVQQWFHNEKRVQATELLLHEKPVSHVQRKTMTRRLPVAS